VSILPHLKRVRAECCDSWADGWRGFIDGAFEMGRASAWRILKADKDRARTSRL
jgi:hypothetical protein